MQVTVRVITNGYLVELTDNGRDKTYCFHEYNHVSEFVDDVLKGRMLDKWNIKDKNALRPTFIGPTAGDDYTMGGDR